MYKYELIDTNVTDDIKANIDCIPSDSDIKLSELENGAILEVVDWYVLNIESQKQGEEMKQYSRIIIVDKNGNRYSTGSETFLNSFNNAKGIYSAIVVTHPDFEFKIKIGKGKSDKFPTPYLTCVIAR